MDASNVQTSFLGGEWSPYSQGRFDDPEYKRGLNVCRNSFPLETGAWIRRVGTRFLAATRGGAPGKLIAFSFSQGAPYVMEFTDGKVRFYDSTGLVLAEEPRNVTLITTDAPAEVTTIAAANDWADDDTVIFNFPRDSVSTTAAILTGRQFKVTMIDQEHFTIVDALTGAAFDGSSIDWDETIAVTVSRVFELDTPYTNGSWAQLRGVQDEDSVLLLHPTIQTQSMFAGTNGGNDFTLSSALFLDGPYLDPPGDGSYLVPAGTSGVIVLTLTYPTWDNTKTYSDGSRFFAATAKRAGGNAVSVEYSAGTVVQYLLGYYVSIKDGNINHAPDVSPTWWTQIAPGAIVGPSGFQQSDIGRLIRVNSAPDPWDVGTTYGTKSLVTYQDAYYTALQNTTGDVPGTDAVNWGTASNASGWTWGIITAVSSPVVVSVSLQGGDLLYNTNILAWRLGLYSNSTGWPSCGTYHEGRFWLGGSLKNRFDSSQANGDHYSFSPTGPDGTVADDNAIGYVLDSPSQNLILWMTPDHQGISMGTAAGEWLLEASSNNDVLTPTSIQAHNVTKIGCSNVEPRRAGLVNVFVQRYGQKLIEYVCDLFSSKFAGLNLSKYTKHLTGSGIMEVAYQQELVPTIWMRMGDGSLVGSTYKRESLMVSQPPAFNGWHRHDLGSGRTVEALVSGPSPNGLLDSITMITKDPDTNVHYVEVLTELFDETATMNDAWFVDCATAPLGGMEQTVDGVLGVVFSGFAMLEGKTVSAVIGGLDLGDFVVTNGAIFCPYQSDADKLLTRNFLIELANTGDPRGNNFGALGTPVHLPNGDLTQTMLECQIPSLAFTHQSNLNLGDVVLPDWERDRVFFLSVGNGPQCGIVSIQISTGDLIKYNTIDKIFGVPIAPYWVNSMTYGANPFVLGSDNKFYFAITAKDKGHDPTTAFGVGHWVNPVSPLSSRPTQWGSGTTFASGDFVWGGAGDNKVYRSLQNGNLNHTPSSSPTWWQFYFNVPSPWDQTVTYGKIVSVTGSNDNTYYSIQGGNLNNDPAGLSVDSNAWWFIAPPPSGYPLSCNRTGIGLDFNGDITMYEGGSSGPLVKIDGTTLTQKALVRSIPSPTGPVAAIQVLSNTLQPAANWAVSVSVQNPAADAVPTVIVMNSDSFGYDTSSDVYELDINTTPVASRGYHGVGYSSAFVMTRKGSGIPDTVHNGLYEFIAFAYTDDAFLATDWRKPKFINARFVSGDREPGSPISKFTAGSYGPSDVDSTWTFFSGTTGLLYDDTDGNVMTIVNTTNPAAWSNTAAYTVLSNQLGYVLGSDNFVYKLTTPPATWSSFTTYAAGNLVAGSDNFFYASVGSGNSGHNPVGDLGIHWTKTPIDPTADVGVHWTKGLTAATQLTYLIKVRTADAVVLWSLPIVSAFEADDYSFGNCSITDGTLVFIENLSPGVWQGRIVDTLTGTSSTFAVAGFNSYGLGYAYNDNLGLGIIYSQYTSATMGAPTPVPPNTASSFTSWGIWSPSRPYLDTGVAYSAYTVPAVVGFTYTSDGQLLPPVAPAETGARNGPAFGKTRRYHRYAMSVANAGPIFIGTDYAGVGNNQMRPARFKSRSGKGALLLSAATLYTGEHSDTVDSDYDLYGMLAWRITRPVPAAMLAIGGMIQTNDR